MIADLDTVLIAFYVELEDRIIRRRQHAVRGLNLSRGGVVVTTDVHAWQPSCAALALDTTTKGVTHEACEDPSELVSTRECARTSWSGAPLFPGRRRIDHRIAPMS